LVVTRTTLVGWLRKAGAISRIAGADIAGVVEFRTVDSCAGTATVGLANIAFGTEVAIVAGIANLRDRYAGPRVAHADIALVGEISALRIEAAVGIDEVAMVGDVLVQRIRADGNDVVRIRGRTSEMADGYFALRPSGNHGGQRRDRPSQDSPTGRLHRKRLDQTVELSTVHRCTLLSIRERALASRVRPAP
jgi:hypothetical protein